MPLKYRKVTGTRDILEPELSLWRKAEDTAHRLFYIFGYREIRTPIIENTELFKRSVGSYTDIVEKEMYTFESNQEKSVSLRPEETAGVVRAYLENGLYSLYPLSKLYYIGPMFRRERPQRGRFRQFHQIGAEIIGSSASSADYDTISWIVEYLRRLGVSGAELNINTAGCAKCRPAYIMLLKEKLEPELKHMCGDCRRRYERNVFRLLDCKQERCLEIIAKMPVMKDFLCSFCGAHFSELLGLLDAKGIQYELNHRLVRGIDYYTRTVYEFIYKGLGTQNAVAAGGRYDLLTSDMGGVQKGAVGFSIGEERLVMMLGEDGRNDVPEKHIQVYLVSLGRDSYNLNIALLGRLREMDVSSDIDYEGKSLKAQMRAANKLGARFAVIRGTSEIEEGVVILKDMNNGEEERIPYENTADAIKGRITSAGL